jgi:hypothetical protein
MFQENPISVAVLEPQETENGRLRISYFLKSEKFAGDAPHTGFGIEAKLYMEDELVDDVTVSDVACSQSEVTALIGLLSRNTVTPVTLRDVIEDYINA